MLSRIKSESEPAEYKPRESLDYHFLTEVGLSLQNAPPKSIKSRSVVPPHTPNSEYEFDTTINTLPPFPKLDKLDIPYVREKGIKYCIEYFGNFFKCNDYETNLIQFWFLDVITDCVWFLQDDFRLPQQTQKIVLEWFLYFMDLLRNSRQNVTHRKFFGIFKDAILLAAEIVEEGCQSIPPPDEVFELLPDSDQLHSSASDVCSTSTFDKDSTRNVSYIEIANPDGTCRYELPKEICTCADYDLSSIKSLTETESQSQISETEEDDDEITIPLYTVDSDLPARFLPLFTEIDGEVSEESNKSTEPSGQLSNAEEDKFEIYEVADKYEIVSGTDTPSGVSSKKLPSTIDSISREKSEEKMKQLTDEEILKGLMVQKIWEQRLLDMDDPKKGWVSYDVNDNDATEITANDSNSSIGSDDEWIDITLKNRKSEIDKFENRATLNFGILWAIIELVFKYFYEGFQFSLVKLALQATPEVITQTLNTEWKIPKKNRVPFVKPKIEKPKSAKVKKGKGKPAKQKKPKPKKPKPKSGKAKKAAPKKKGPKMSPEEKKRLAREKLELLKLEEARRIAEENKRYMYPLADGVTDEFFMGIFENWVQPKRKKKGEGKKGEGKKGGKKGK